MLQPWVRCFGKSSLEAAFKASYQPFKKKLYFYYSIVTLHFSTKNGIVLAEARACNVELVSNDLMVYTVWIPLRRSKPPQKRVIQILNTFVEKRHRYTLSSSVLLPFHLFMELSGG